MAKEGSVAPKERVNIVYRPATGGAQEEVELPLKLMLIGDYTLQQDERSIEERKAINIDKDNFDQVMREHKLSLDVNVPDRLSGEEGEEMGVSLKFETLKDFSPEAVVRQVPELNQLLELREALTALKGPLGNVPAFRKTIQAVLADEGSRGQLLDELGLEDGKKS